MPWRSPSRSRSEPGAAARHAPFAGGRLLTVMMPRGYYRPVAAAQPPGRPAGRAAASLGLLSVGQSRVRNLQSMGSKPDRCGDEISVRWT